MKIFFFIFFLSSLSWAQSGKLRWGADIQSGAPFSYKSPEDPNKVIGFEAEIVEAIAKELGLEVQFTQNTWSGLIEGLKRGDYDIVVNGIEITPDRAEVVHFSEPYYLTSETLAVSRRNTDIHSLEDTQNHRVGTLGASLAERILREQKFPIDILTYSEEVHLYGDLALGRLDAVLLDEPIALYYAKPNPEIKLVASQIGQMEYGIVTRRGDKEFNHRVDGALKKLIQNGTVRAILERWNLWNGPTATAWKMDPTPQSSPVNYDKYLETAWAKRSFTEKLKKYISFLPLLGRGAIMTLEISLLSMVLAMLVGLLTALMRLYGPPLIATAAVSFVEIFRGTPLLIQLYLIFYGLPHVGIRLDPFMAAVIGLGLNYGACEAENYRAGILAVPKTQMDGALALGMNHFQALRYVIIPQAIRIVIPPVTNDFIALLKDSSLVSVISMVELTTVYGQLASTYFDYLGIGLLTAAIYFLIGLPFVRLSRYFESQLATAQMPTKKR
jgi:polar amino acid transport system substrate-binding protein